MRPYAQQYDRNSQRAERIRACLADPEWDKGNLGRAQLEAELAELNAWLAANPAPSQG
jgi:hypothetical protein